MVWLQSMGFPTKTRIEGDLDFGWTAEVFCGCARLSAELKKAGFGTMPVDWKGNAHRVKGAFFKIDLTSQAGQQRLQELLEEYETVYVHFAPPCGTLTLVLEKSPCPGTCERLGSLSPNRCGRRVTRAACLG